MRLLPVDTAVTVIVNAMSLIDDTDFKTREVAIAYNQAGMDLVWNFETTAGVITQTAVTPTTAGVYDWTHVGDGIYKIEIPASGGASINNDTEGYGWFSGICTGVLPWVGPTYSFVPAHVVNGLIAGSDNLQVDTVAVSGTAQTANDNGADINAILVDTTAIEADTQNIQSRIPAALVGGRIDANVGAINNDSSAANNLELQYDGTGLTGDVYPATQSQVGNIASGTAAVNTTAESFTKTGTEPETNTYTATHQLDGIYHIVEDVASSTDAYYQFDIGGNGVPVSIQWQGYARSNGDSYAIYAYNWSGTSWEQIGSISAQNGTTIVTNTYDLTSGHAGTGANLGKVRFRFFSTDGTEFATDRLLCSYAIVSQSVGYADGAIWVDTNYSNTNTEVYVDGVADNPVSTWAAALTLSASLGITRFHIKGGSSITLTSDSTRYELLGDGLMSVNLNGQTLTNAYFYKSSISGTGAGSGVVFEDCELNNSISVPPCYIARCSIKAASGTPFTANGVGEYVLVDCFSGVAGSGTPFFDFSGTGGTSGVNIRRWAGGANITLDSNNTLSLEVLSGGGVTVTTGGANTEIRGIPRSVTVAMSSTETVQFVGVTGPIALNGTTTGTVNLYGVCSSVTDTTSAATVNDSTVSNANIRTEMDSNSTQLSSIVTGLDTIDGIVDDILVDTAEIGAAGAGLTEAGGDGDHLTAIDLPNQTMDIVGNITGNLSGSVGSVTGNVGGIAGTITTLDALDTAQDTQHSTTQSAIAGLNNLSAAQVNAEVDTALADYDPPTRAELTSDTNSILSKLLKYVQLLFRKDAAIATDNATELTAINADEGSGAGAYDNTTDSTEAIRDRGDAAWTTGGGGSSSPLLMQNTTIATLTSQTSFTLSAGSADNDTYNGCIAIVTDQSTSTQKAIGRVSDYTGSTKRIILESDPGIFTMTVGDTIDIISTDLMFTEYTNARAGYLDNINNVDLQTTTAQTGDSYARLGAPAGTSVSADIAENQADLDTIILDVGTAQSDLDILTGTDGATLATSQPNYAPNTTTPPTAGDIAADVWAAGTRTLTANTNLNDPTAAAIVAALLGEAIESGKTFETLVLDMWAVIAGNATADDDTAPTSITYDSPDDTVQVTHSLTSTGRTTS